MLTGHRFHLTKETPGIEINSNHNRVAVTVPAGQTITILSGPRPDDKRMVDVQWGDKTLVMFYVDIQTRCEEVKSRPA
jgi:hypothetical protein